MLTDVIYVMDGATLSIDPGVVVKGRPGSALVVTRGSQLLARGTKSKPEEPGNRRIGLTASF